MKHDYMSLLVASQVAYGQGLFEEPPTYDAPSDARAAVVADIDVDASAREADYESAKTDRESAQTTYDNDTQQTNVADNQAALNSATRAEREALAVWIDALQTEAAIELLLAIDE